MTLPIPGSDESKPRHTFGSGASSSGQYPPFNLIPIIFLLRTAIRFGLGAKKHGKYNWKKGLKDKDFILDRLNHALVHTKKAIDLIEAGKPFDDDDLGGVAVNIAMAMEFQWVNNLQCSCRHIHGESCDICKSINSMKLHFPQLSDVQSRDVNPEEVK
jgi:hypothetical protein